VVSVRERFSVRLVGEFLLHACYVFDGECQGMMWILVVLARGYKPSRGFAAAVGGVDRFMVVGRVGRPSFRVFEVVGNGFLALFDSSSGVQIGTSQGAIWSVGLSLFGWFSDVP